MHFVLPSRAANRMAPIVIAIYRYQVKGHSLLQVLHKLSVAAPSRLLVENYMVEIAKTYKVAFEPDIAIMAVSVSFFTMSD